MAPVYIRCLGVLSNPIVAHEYHSYIPVRILPHYSQYLTTLDVIKHTLCLKDHGSILATVDTKVAPAIELDTPIRSITKNQRIRELFLFILIRQIRPLCKKFLNPLFKLRTVGR